MAATTPPSITALPAPPDPNDRSTFNSRAYPWSIAQQTLATEVGAVAANVYDNAVEAKNQADSATSSASTATTYATTATTQAGIATTQAGIATGAAGTATTQAGIATTQAGLAGTLYENFDKRYLGSKAAPPSLDNGGNALLVGALYWDTTIPAMRAWDGSAWNTVTATTAATVDYTPAGAGAVATDVQTKLREFVSVKDFGAVGNGVADDTAAFSNAAAASGLVKVPPGVYYMPSAPALGNAQFLIEKGVSATGAYGGFSVFTSPSPGVIQPNSSPNELATTHIRRQANHTGGTPGYTSCALRAETFASANDTNFEWAILGRVYNQANSGENVGVYGQGVKAASGPTWGMVAEGRDTTSTENPTSGLLGIEVDIFANGTDINNNRIGIDVVAGQGLTGGEHAECRAYAGIRVGGRNVAGDVGSFYNGLVVNSATYAGIALSNTGTIGILFSAGANVQVGVDFSAGAFAQFAMRFARQQNIALEATGAIKIQTLGATDARLRFIHTASEVLGINIENNATTARLVVSGACGHGIDFSGATIGTTAIKMARGQGVSWEQTNTITQALDASLSVLRLNHSGAEKIGLIVSGVDANNGIRINGTAVVGTRKTGWAGPTGPADRTTFDTSTVTLVNLAQRVKALIDDLTSHGLIGS